MDTLDEKGFIFLDATSKPYLCRMWEGEPWLFYWHEGSKKFVSLHKVNQTDIWGFPRNLTEKEQNIYWEMSAQKST